MTIEQARPPLLVVAAGGTGGHMFPAQALAETMLESGWRVALSTDARGMRYASGFPEDVSRTVASSASLAQGSAWTRATAPFAILAGTASAVRNMRADLPACVVGFGGYPALPALAAAGLLKLPRLIHEQNGVLGRVNRALATRVHAVACGTWPTAVPNGAHAVPIGTPLREAVRARAGAPYVPPASSGPVPLLVIGGSQGAGLFSRIVPEALRVLEPDLRGRLRLSQQVRPEDIDRTQATYDDLGVTGDLRSFFDDVPERLAGAALIVSRAGAGSVADITAIGRPAVFVPYAAAMDDHQAANAAPVVEAGGAFMIREEELTAEGLARHIEAILGDSEGAAAMAAASLAQGRPDATQHLAELAMAVAGQETGT
mgnify:FL=1